MNIFAGINSIEDYEAIPKDYKVLCDYVKENYETSQPVFLNDGFEEAKGIMKYNYKGYSIKIADGRRMDGYFDTFHYIDFSDDSPRELYIIFDNDKLVFSNLEDKTNFITFLNEYNEDTKKFIEMGIEKFSKQFDIYLDSNELINSASNLLAMFPKQFLTNVTLHDMLIYYLSIFDDISKTYIGFSNDDVDRNAALLRKNKSLYSAMEEIYKTLKKYRSLMKQKYDIPDLYAQYFAFRSIDTVFSKIYSENWESKGNYADSYDLTVEGMIEYVYQCCKEDIISSEDEAALLSLAYYCRKKFHLNPRNIRDITVKIMLIIKEYNKIIKDKQFTERILHGNASINTHSNYCIDDIDLMTGSEFEELIAKLFIKMGYSAHTTKTSGDQGIDVIAEKNGIKYGIQAKCYSGSVGNSAVQEAVAGKAFYNCDKVIVITNNSFTNSAIELATANGVILWDRTILKDKLSYLNQ